MMIPNAEHIMKKRHHNRRRLRFMALVLAIIAIVFPIWWFVWAVIEGDLDDDPGVPVGWCAGFMTPAVILWFTERWLSKLLVPMGSSHCPKCGYLLMRITKPQCPECGIDVPSVFVERESDNADSTSAKG